MFGFFKREQEPLGNLADIKELPNGGFALISTNGLEATYSRRRDAVRGAKRRGLTIA